MRTLNLSRTIQYGFKDEEGEMFNYELADSLVMHNTQEEEKSREVGFASKDLFPRIKKC